MIEAERKAVVRDAERVLATLETTMDGPGRAEVYQDTYYDLPGALLDAEGRELRVRTVHGRDGARTVLTYKGGVVDEASGSKSESETEVADTGAIHDIVRGLGYQPLIRFEKHCRNYSTTLGGRQILVTLVRVPEIDGTWLEVETQATEDDLGDALDTVWRVMADLGIDEGDLTTELYTDAVRAARG
ncbi:MULTISPECIES: class IV adenylate cyclase [Streptomyces]|uniref:class IV adenylate cyclase n=1 Tax=Streptomyces TaxID=1883 RepID=UPI00224974AD|nr:class IV adenylate cyclase [Streptomyces sp. JHD 1]MCX2971142.1 class IV adenylate cyclase [Streptomyces sp. JHD 1]